MNASFTIVPRDHMSMATAGIEAAAYGFRNRFDKGGELEYDRDSIKTLAAEFMRHLGDLVECTGGDRTYLEADVSDMRDAISNAFQHAIDQRDDEDGNDPVERSYAKSDRMSDATRIL